MTKVFISYSRAGSLAFAEQLHVDLAAHGIEVWRDVESMPSGGRSLVYELRDAIAGADYVLLIVEPAAMMSEYVTAEWRLALDACKVVVPVLRAGRVQDLPGELAMLPAIEVRDSDGYRESLRAILRTISAGPPALGALHGVPALPPSFVPRPETLRLAEEVLRDGRLPVVVSSIRRPTALHGMGGIGKSVLASQLGRRCDIRRAFPDGVIWLAFGQDPDVPQLAQTVARCLGEPPLPSGLEAAMLRSIIADRACLLILDDVWSIRAAEPFRDAVQSSRSRLVLTTRNADLATSLGAAEVALDVLDDDAALALLAAWVELGADSLPEAARRLARACGNLPLALALCGAIVKDGARWADVLGEITSGNPRFAARDLPSYPHRTVTAAFQSSLDFLAAADDRAEHLYRSLAVFPEDLAIPEATILTFWDHLCAMGEAEARTLLALLHRRALVRIEETPAGRTVSLHDLLRAVLIASVTDLPALHRTLVDSYRRLRRDTWCDVPDDGYFIRRIAPHMQHGGLTAELHALARDGRFLERQARSAPDEPGLVLRTIDAALQGAIDADDPARMAEFMLAHARRVAVLNRESPLDALRSGSLPRAWALADLNDHTTRILWHRLLVWELSASARCDDARSTAARVGHADPAGASRTQERYLKFLAARSSDASSPPVRDDELLRTILRPRLGSSREPSNWDPLIPHSCFLDDSIPTRRWLSRGADDSAYAKRRANELACARRGEPVSLAALDRVHTIDLMAAVGAVVAQASGWDTAAPFFAEAIAIADRPGNRYERARMVGARAAIALELHRAGQRERSHRLFRDALKHAMKEQSDQASMVREIISCIASAGEPDLAITSAMSIRDRRQRMWVLLAIATTLTRTEDRPLRETIAAKLERLCDDEPTARAFLGLELFLLGNREGSVANCLRAARNVTGVGAPRPAYCDPEVAMDVSGLLACAEQWQLAEQVAMAIKNADLRCSASLAMCSILELKGRGPAARSLWSRLVRTEDRDARTSAHCAVVIAEIAASEATRGRSSTATCLIEKAVEQCRCIGTPALQEQTLSAVLTRAIHCGQIDAAIALVSASLNPANRLRLLLVAARHRARPFDATASPSLSTVLAAFDEVTRSFQPDELLAEALAIAAEHGDADTACTFCKRIKDPERRALALLKTAVALHNAGDCKRALSFVKKAASVGARSSSYRPKAIWYEAEALIELGQATAAEQLVERLEDPVVSYARAEARSDFRSYLKGLVAIKLAREGHVDQITDLQEIRSPGRALRTIAIEQARRGNFTVAEQLAEEIYWISVKASAYGELAIIAAKAGDEERCRRYFAWAAGCTARCNNARPDDIEPLRAKLRELGMFIARDGDADEQRADRALREARAGHAAAAIEQVREPWIHPEHYLPLIASALADRCGKHAVTALLAPAARSLETAIDLCAVLARCYPAAVMAIADALRAVPAVASGAIAMQ